MSSKSQSLFRFALLSAAFMLMPQVAYTQESGVGQPGTSDTSEKLYEFSDVFLDVPKRQELERTKSGSVIAPVSIAKVDWGQAFEQMRRDINRLSISSRSTQERISAADEAQSVLFDDTAFSRFVRDLRYAKPLLRSVGEPTLPVLLPADPDMLQAYKTMSPSVPNRSAVKGELIVFKGFRNHYAATFKLEEVSLLINGSRLSTRNSSIAEPVDRSRRMEDGTRFQPLERDDVGVSCAFERFGAVYTLEVVCDHPFIDSRCSDDAYIMDIYEKLLLFGGNPR